MKASCSRYLLLLFLLTCELAPEVAGEVEESSDGPGTAQGPMWLTDVPAAEEFISAAEVAIIGFFQDLEIPVVSVFHSMVQKFQDVSFGISNNSEVLAHYNITRNSISLFRLTGFGLFNTMIEIHLLLVISKASPEYAENMNRYRKAARLFQGKILFVLVDSGMKENEKVISFFKLKKSQLPALAIYRTIDDQWDTLPITEVTVEHVKSFCDGFLEGKLLRENRTSEEKTPKVEL
ncbi:endoplasmic reticulum resident protein 27 isoform X2 [Marmota flaviventris]|uniref:endoplasmic reticulum resident protein 27 isoform X2 n=1 Tax=Marmota flaviventris TaxID=93162 RepID=UPI003A892FA2